MRTSNPVLNDNAFDQVRNFGVGQNMTIQGTVNKSFALLALLLLSASWTWGKFYAVAQPLLEGVPYGGQPQTPQFVMVAMMGGAIGGFIMALITVFKKEWAPITAPVYALLEGLFIGGISAFFELQYPGIVIQAVGLTFGTLFALLLVYKSGLIQVTQKFRVGIAAATGAIALFYMVVWIASFFGANLFSEMRWGSSPMGIGFSLVVVTIAALNLVLDFDFIERGSQSGVPKYMEWYGAFGLMVTLIWLYIEILRLLAKLRNRR
ncbi:MAG: Bax inhibitor-1/YccA family protein [Candidatus Omnitrophica bacterium]|nr:Bax inhibitor-1/YccA family protein [Candidatus Omnitrophota bacterium]